MKMKKGKKILAVLCSIIMGVTALTGCSDSSSQGKDVEGKTEIKLSYWMSGLGEEWLNNIVDSFEKENPEYYVTVTSSANASSLTSAFGMADLDETDIYMNLKNEAIEFMEPLDTLLETTAKGDEKTLQEKFNSNYLAYEKSADGHYYTLTYGGGMIGLYYNKALFDQAEITQLPRTTDELTVLCDTLNSVGITPLCHFKNGGYYDSLLKAYMVQYDGMDYYLNKFWACVDDSGQSPSKAALTNKDGRYYALKAMEKFITPTYTLAGSVTQSHTEIQTQFIQEKAAMMVNGSWIENEMKINETDSKIGVMKVPVLSAIVNQLATVKTDSALRKLITAIDQVTEGEKQLSDFASGADYVVDGVNVSAADWNKVAEARNVIPSNYAEQSVFVPSYSDAKEGAMKFLEYLYSDAGYKIYTEATKCPIPMQLSTEQSIDTANMSEAQQAQFDWISTDALFADGGYSQKHEIFLTGGAGIFNVQYAGRFCASNAEDRMTADEVWELWEKTVDDNYENNWLMNMKER